MDRPPEPLKRLPRFSLLTLLLLTLLAGCIYGLWRKRIPWVVERVPQITGLQWIERSSGPYCFSRNEGLLSVCAPRLNLLIHGIPAGEGCVDLSPDGRRLLALKPGLPTCGVLTDLTNGSAVSELTHAAEIKLALFSPDSRRLATFSRDGVLKIWDAATGRLQEERAPASDEHANGNETLDFSPSGNRIAISHYPEGDDEDDWRVRVWDSSKQKLICNYDGILVNFDGSDQRVVTNKSGRLGILNLDDSAFIDIGVGLPHHWMRGLIAPDGKELRATDNGDNRVWDVSTGASRTYSEQFVTYSSDNSRVVTRDDTAEARGINIRDRQSGALLFRGTESGGSLYGSGIYSDDCERFVSDESGPVRLFDVRTGTPITTLVEDAGAQRGMDIRQSGFVFSASGDRIYYLAGSCLYIFRRYRPEPWWGPACLPEFWLAVAIVLALLRNLIRIAISLRRPAPAPVRGEIAPDAAK